MIHVEFFDLITIEIPYPKVYSRLGYAKGTTTLTSRQKADIEKNIDEASGYITLKGAGCRLAIERKEEHKVVLSGAIEFNSQAISRFLHDSQEVLFMGATAGADIINKIKEQAAHDNVTAAVVFDALASEMVDEALSWIMEFFDYQVRRENKQLTPGRYSAGYNDFSLDNQKIMCETLQMSELGVKLNDHYILIPEKSVTAIAGIQPI
ncbi:MAG: hypothetical protein JXD21_02525 [Candidatus Omnitrophica bacterium]|nr:hypothetical protein [Candidatus Omnitrophota bacterium]